MEYTAARSFSAAGRVDGRREAPKLLQLGCNRTQITSNILWAKLEQRISSRAMPCCKHDWEVFNQGTLLRDTLKSPEEEVIHSGYIGNNGKQGSLREAIKLDGQSLHHSPDISSFGSVLWLDTHTNNA